MEYLILAFIVLVFIFQVIVLFAFGRKKPLDEKALRAESEIIRDAVSREIGRFREEQSSSLLKTRSELTDNFERIRIGVDKKLSDIQTNNQKELESMRLVVDEKLQKTLESRLSESFKTVSDRLEQVHQGLGEMQGLAQNVGDLKKALINVKTRGSYGEIQLKRLLDEVFATGQYEENFSTKGNSERVEFALRLPGKNSETPVYLPIDSKFPIEDYDRLQTAYESGDKDGILSAQKAIEIFMKKSAKDIKEKYVCPPKTTDFGLIFLPTEGLYAEVLRIPGLVETLVSQYHINVSGPTTLLALLNALQMGFNTLAIEQRSSEVWQILGKVKNEFDKFGVVLTKTQEKIRQADKEMDELVGVRTRKIISSLKNVENLPDFVQAPEIANSDDTDDLPL